MSRIRSSLGLLGFLAATFAVGAGGLAFAPELGGGTWYERLPKAPWNPPGWVFGPAWTALYTLMAVAAWLVWRARGSLRAASFPLSLYALQLVLNGLWTLLFFGQQMVVAALVGLVALLVAIAATLVAFWRVRPMAGALLFPYLLWVAFATTLNAYIASRL